MQILHILTNLKKSLYGIPETLPSLGEKVLCDLACQSVMLKKSGNWVTLWLKSYKNCKLSFAEDTHSRSASTSLWKKCSCQSNFPWNCQNKSSSLKADHVWDFNLLASSAPMWYDSPNMEYLPHWSAPVGYRRYQDVALSDVMWNSDTVIQWYSDTVI